MINWFCEIREEGKLTRKLLECINTFLLKDGPNLGYKSVKIHKSLYSVVGWQLMIRPWRFWWPDLQFCNFISLFLQKLHCIFCFIFESRFFFQSLFITYAKVQLKIGRNFPEILEKLVDVIIKELDKNVNTGPGVLW